MTFACVGRTVFCRCIQSCTEVEIKVTSNPKILVVVEPEYDPAVVTERAVWLAQLMNCDIQMLLCDPTANPLPIAIIPSDKASEIERAIRQVQEGIVNEMAVRNMIIRNKPLYIS